MDIQLEQGDIGKIAVKIIVNLTRYIPNFNKLESIYIIYTIKY